MVGWLDISEYASKYGVSESTLRRRIRSKTIEHKMERGKYMLQDSSALLEAAPLYARGVIPNAVPKARPAERAANTTKLGPVTPPQDPEPTKVSQTVKTVKAVERTIEKAQLALEEFLRDEEPALLRLRQHHDSVVAENRRLKEHISELETLVKALEAQMRPM
jgi:hypothetical protein